MLKIKTLICLIFSIISLQSFSMQRLVKVLRNPGIKASTRCRLIEAKLECEKEIRKIRILNAYRWLNPEIKEELKKYLDNK